MDFSEKYIKMCEKAEEIQKEWKPQIGDFYYFEKNVYILKESNISNKEESIWLPRQDQLQEIVEELFYDFQGDLKVFDKVRLIDSFSLFVEENEDKFYSYEQFWLAFVMWKKYGKVWNDEKKEWISEK